MICQRHGGPLESGRCWECDMERDIAYQEHDEMVRVTEFKRLHDERSMAR